MKNGTSDSSKFKCYYNLLDIKTTVKAKDEVDCAVFVSFLLGDHTKLFDWINDNSDVMDVNQMYLMSLISKMKYIVDGYAYAVSLFFNIRIIFFNRLLVLLLFFYNVHFILFFCITFSLPTPVNNYAKAYLHNKVKILLL